MKTLDTFLESAQRSPQADLAEAYKTSVADVEKASQRLVGFLRVKEGRPVYADGVQAVIPQVQAAEDKLKRTKADVDTYLAALGDDDSVESLVNKLSRAKRSKENLKHDINAVTERKVRAGMSAQQAQAAEDVQQVLDKKDKLMPDLDKTIADLTKRIVAAREVLARYHNEGR